MNHNNFCIKIIKNLNMTKLNQKSHLKIIMNLIETNLEQDFLLKLP